MSHSKTVRVRLDGFGGMPMEERVRKSVYATGMDFEPDERRMTIAAARPEIKALTWWDFIEPSFSGNGALLDESENPREAYFRLLALKDKLFEKKV